MAASILALSGEIAAAEQEIVQTFATCTGRLSAQMEHEWLMNDPASDQTEARRAAMVSLLDAVMPEDQGSQVLNWRINAKVAHATLLTRATFNEDKADALWATNRVEAHLSACTGLLLG